MKKLWIRVNSSDEVEGVKKYISSMPKEGFHGDIPICVYAIAGKTIHKLDGDYSVSESAIDALEGRYGEKNVVLTERKDTEDIHPAESFNLSPLERIADALEEISSNISMMEYYLENISDNMDRCVIPVRDSDNLALNVVGEVSAYNLN